MIAAYRLLSRLLYASIYPFGRLRIALKDDVWRQRMALALTSGQRDIWIHAASVGEIKVIANLLQHLGSVSSCSAHVTVMTRAGYAEATRLVNERVSISFFPLDVPVAIDRLLDAVRPKLLVIAETEIWPNLIEQTYARKIPIILVNGRMTEKAFRKYRLIERTMRKLLSRYEKFFIKSDGDATRYAHFGVPQQKIVIAREMKFDTAIVSHNQREIAEMRERLGIAAHEKLIIAGSTRPGEESQLLDAFGRLRNKFTHLRMLLAPRHLARVGEVIELLSLRQIPYTIHPSMESDHTGNAATVIILNSIGELARLYAAADIAFVGGTLTDVGGHNLLEPVWMGTPVVFGPSVSNVSDSAEYIIKHNYGAMADTADELATVVEEYFAGNRTFARRTEHDSSQSSSALIADYIVRKLAHA